MICRKDRSRRKAWGGRLRDETAKGFGDPACCFDRYRKESVDSFVIVDKHLYCKCGGIAQGRLWLRTSERFHDNLFETGIGHVVGEAFSYPET